LVVECEGVPKTYDKIFVWECKNKIKTLKQNIFNTWSP